MSDEELLEKVKLTLGITGEFQDATLGTYIEEVKQYLADAGVKEAVIESKYAAGAIARGVADLWNYGSGSAALSNYFKERTIQLCYKGDEDV